MKTSRSDRRLNPSLWSVVLVVLTASVAAGQAVSFEKAAERLQAAVVTVRISRGGSTVGDARVGDSAKAAVTVCSGVSLGDGLVVTPALMTADSVVRITLPGGEQTKASLSVLDDYCGLAMLVCERDDLSKLEPAAEMPAVGKWVVGASAWGAESPAVSLGIVGARERQMTGWPPLLQCDLRTTDTSSGGAVVNVDGELVGIVVAAGEVARDRRGWTYAVPVGHVQRLLRSHQEKSRDESVLILKRRRPTVGMVLSGTSDGIVVSRIEENSPAERAGIRVGDRVIEANGIKIRSVYQAVRQVLVRQPGDAISFRIRQGTKDRDVQVVLGGGIEVAGGRAELVRPRLDIEVANGGIRARTGTGVRELIAPADGLPARLEIPNSVSDAEKIRLLERAVERYQNAIKLYRDQLRRLSQEKRGAD